MSDAPLPDAESFTSPEDIVEFAKKLERQNAKLRRGLTLIVSGGGAPGLLPCGRN